MLILFTISVICFIALIGAGVAMVRHVRSGRRQERSAAPPQPEFKDHLQSAVRYGSAHERRQVHHQRVESITARKEVPPSAENKVSAGEKKIPAARWTGRRHSSNDRIDRTHFNKDLTDSHPSHATSERVASRRRS